MANIETATHYWSMSHGEGRDLPMVRAGALGLIAPRHSGYVDCPDKGAATAILAGILRGDGLPSARDHLLRRFSWSRAADRLLAILDEAGLR